MINFAKLLLQKNCKKTAKKWQKNGIDKISIRQESGT